MSRYHEYDPMLIMEDEKLSGEIKEEIEYQKRRDARRRLREYNEKTGKLKRRSRLDLFIDREI